MIAEWSFYTPIKKTSGEKSDRSKPIDSVDDIFPQIFNPSFNFSFYFLYDHQISLNDKLGECEEGVNRKVRKELFWSRQKT